MDIYNWIALGIGLILISGALIIATGCFGLGKSTDIDIDDKD